MWNVAGTHTHETVQWVILCLYSSVSAVFRALAVHQESVMFMSRSESVMFMSRSESVMFMSRSESVMFTSRSELTLWMSSAPAHFLNLHPVNHRGSPEDKIQCKNIFIKIHVSINAQWHTFWPTYLFSAGTHRGNRLVSSRFSIGDLNFCVHSIPLWEPCAKKMVMLRASIHRPVGGVL